MSISKLHIFSKKRDATAAMKGYEFQHLKTLETWLMNRINNVDDIIYCDFEEDIFSRNIPKGESKFRQIKLYSTNFSFSSDAIQETIANFFMLYVKGEYLFDDVIFSFETNASIVGRIVKGNDADLLKEWSEGQGVLKNGLLDRVRTKVQQILSEYIQKEYEAQKKERQPSPELETALKTYKELSDDAIDKFIQSLQWSFDGLDANTAMQKQLETIKGLIEKLPLPLHESSDVNLALLYREVIHRSIQDDPEDRKLTNASLDLLLLQTGDEKNQWYAEVFSKWRILAPIITFNAGEFYQAVSAARHYRMNFSDATHRELWQKILLDYTNLADIEPSYKRKAIYELIFILMDGDLAKEQSSGALKGHEEKIRYYFQNWEERNNLSDIQEDITLLQIILAQSVSRQVGIDEQEVNEWKANTLAFLEKGLSNPKNSDEKCLLLELRGSFEIHGSIDKSERAVQKAIEYYQQILPVLPNTKFYAISPLFDELESIHNLLIQFSKNTKAISAIERFLDELQEAAIQSGNRHVIAKRYVNKGVQHLHAGGLFNFLQALNYFHKAKELWYLEHTKEGYILSLLNLAQVYYALGMNLAGKYYALCAIWSTWQFNDKSLFHRLAHGMGLLFAGNYKQGAWMSAIDDFMLFLQTRNEFQAGGWSDNSDKLFQKALPDLAFIVYASPKLAPELTHYFNYLKGQWGDFWDSLLAPIVEEMEKIIPDETHIIKAAQKHITYEAMSDIGKTRLIAFNAQDVEWRIQFNNTYQLTAIGEEFTSALQVILCEIARTDKNTLGKNKVVTINITKTTNYDTACNDEKTGEWQVVIPELDSKEQAKISYHYGYIGAIIKTILFSISNLSKDEFDKFFYQTLHEKEKIAQRALCTNTYQKVFRNSIGEEEFKKSKRHEFNGLPPHLTFPHLIKLLVD